MVTVSKDQLKKAIKLIGGAYPRFDIGKELFDVWYAEISKWEASCFDEAVKDCLSTCEFPPNLAELKKHYEVYFSKREEAKGWYIAEYKSFLRMFPDCSTEGVAELFASKTLLKRSTEGYLEGIEKAKKLRAKVKEGDTPIEFLQKVNI